MNLVCYLTNIHLHLHMYIKCTILYIYIYGYNSVHLYTLTIFAHFGEQQELAPAVPGVIDGILEIEAGAFVA